MNSIKIDDWIGALVIVHGSNEHIYFIARPEQFDGLLPDLLIWLRPPSVEMAAYGRARLIFSHGHELHAYRDPPELRKPNNPLDPHNTYRPLAVRKCRECHCTDEKACVRTDKKTGEILERCRWVEKNLCSFCSRELNRKRERARKRAAPKARKKTKPPANPPRPSITGRARH